MRNSKGLFIKDNNEEEIIDLLTNKCSDLEKRGLGKYEFLGFPEKYKNKASKIRLKHPKFGVWESATIHSFLSEKSLSPRKIFTESECINLIEETCSWINKNKKSRIIFLGFEGEFKGKTKSRIKLMNLQTGERWSVLCGGFLSFKSSTKPKNNYIDRINSSCVKISDPKSGEIIEFKGFVNGRWEGINTYLILHNTLTGETWNTTKYKDFIQSPVKRGGYYHRTEDEILNQILSICDQISNEYSKIEFRGFQTSLRSGNSIIKLYNSLLDFEWDTKLRSFVENKNPIPASKGEIYLEKYLMKLNLDVIRHKKIDSSEIYNCPNKYYIEIDFEIKHNGRTIWIEYNGSQHYKKSVKFSKDQDSVKRYAYQYKRDLSIRNYALENCIEFLEIPYLDIDRIPEILQAFLFEGKDITTKIERDDYSEDF